MSGTGLLAEVEGGEEEQDEEEGRQGHRGTARSGRAPAGAGALAEPQEAATATPTQLPPSGRKSLSPWGSFQMEGADGAVRDPSRRRPQVPTLGPLSYSLPVTPQGRHSHGTPGRSDGVADLACEAAQGWAVPPMPYGDLTGGVDRIRQSQSFEQDLSTDFSSAADAAAAPSSSREAFLGGGVRSGGGSRRSMRADLQVSSRPSAAAAAAAAALVEADDARHRSAAEAETQGFGQSQRRTGWRDDGGGDGHAEEEIEEEAEGYARDGGGLDDEIEAGGNDAGLAAVDAAFLLPPRLRQQEQSRSPLSSPPPPPDASLAFAAVTADNSERVSAMEALPATVGGSVTVSAAPTSNPENVLQRMAEACRQAGVELDPSLKNDIDCVLAGGSSPFLGPPPPTPSHNAARTGAPLSSTPPLAPPSPPYLGAPRSLSMGAPRSTPPPAKALGARADNPWGWAAPLDDSEGGREGGEGVLLEATDGAVTTPPSRDRSWTVPSPYQPLDAKFSSTECVPEFRLDVGVGGGRGGGRAGYASAAGVAVGGAAVASPGAETTESSAVGAAAGAVSLGVTAPDVAVVEDVAESVSVPDESRLTSGTTRSVGPAAASAVFVAPMRGYLGGGDRNGVDEEEIRDDDLESRAGRASPGFARARSSEGEALASDTIAREALVAVDETGVHVASVAVGEKQRERAEAAVLSPPMAHARGESTSEEIELAAAITEGSLEHDVEVEEAQSSRRVFREGGGERNTADEEKGRVASLLHTANLELGLDDDDAVDEWDDDLDPGYMVMAVSEQEFLGELPPRDIHPDGALGEKQHRDGAWAGDLSNQSPTSSLPGLVRDDAAFSAECAPSHESSDYGGGGGGGSGGGKAEGVEEASGVGVDHGRRRSWAGQGAGVDDLDAREAAAVVRRASSVEGRRSGEAVQRDSTGTQTAPVVVAEEAEAQVEAEAGHRHALDGEHPWEERRTEEQDVVVTAGAGPAGEEGYGDGDLYERDLADAVAMLDSGGFMLDGENSKAWRSESFSSSAGGGGGGDDDDAARGGASGEEEDPNDVAAAPAASDNELSAGNLLDIGSAAAAVAAVAAAATQEGAREEGATPMMMAAVGESRGGAWGNLRSAQPNLGGGGGYDIRRRVGEEPTRRLRVQDSEEGGGVSRSSRRKHSFEFSETSAGSAGGANEAGGAEGGVPGSFDPMSSLWPRTAADFAFSQDCEESPAAFLSREQDFSSSEVGLAVDSIARTKPIDEAFCEEEHAPSAHDEVGLRRDEDRRYPNSGTDTGGGNDGDGGTALGSTSRQQEQQQQQQQEILLRLRGDGSATRAGGGGAAPGRGNSRVDSAASATVPTADADTDADERLLGGFGSGAGVEWGGGSVVAGAEARDEMLLEEADRDGRVSRRSRSGSSRMVVEAAERGASRGGYEAAAVVGARQVVGRFGDEGVEEREEMEEELESFDLRIVYAKGRTGFQETKAFDWPEGSLVAGRYEVCGYIGKAAFSTALECRDLRRERGRDAVCLKVIKNNKDFFDQSLDEIKLLQRIKAAGDPDEHHVLNMLDFFYFEEHLVIVSELLGDNLYEFSKAVKEAGHPKYFTLPRLCKITRQCLEALSYINSLGLVHCDVKPENVLLSHYGRAEVKLIDFGSSCFITDRLTTYTQSRSYRAPEVVLGLPYGAKIDVWSLGAVVAELVTGHVLLQSESVQTMLARIQGIVGPFPSWMLLEGEEARKYFTPDGCVYQRMDDGSCRGSSSDEADEAGRSSRPGNANNGQDSSGPSLPPHQEGRERGGGASSGGPAKYAIIYPKKTSLKRRLRVKDEDHLFLDFVTELLLVDPTRRPTADEALAHPWVLSGLTYSDDELWYPPDEDHAVRHDEHDGADEEECDGGGVGVVRVVEEYVGVGGMVGDDEGQVGGGEEEEEMVSPRRRSV